MTNDADDRWIAAERVRNADGVAHVGRALHHAERTAAPLRVQLFDGELDPVVDGLHARALRIEGDPDADFIGGALPGCAPGRGRDGEQKRQRAGSLWDAARVDEHAAGRRAEGAGFVAREQYDVRVCIRNPRPERNGGFHVGATAIFRAPPIPPPPNSRMHHTDETAGSSPLVGVIMGSRSDLRVMSAAAEMLVAFSVPHELRIVSAHRTPEWMFEYARSAESRGLEVIIAAAGGAAHLPGMVAANTVLPVLGVPVSATQLNGVDALLSIVQMPKGIPVGTLAIGEPGAANAALLAIAILANSRPELRDRLRAWRDERTAAVLADRDVSIT